MARKSEIRALAREARDALAAASKTSDEREADRLIAHGLARLSEAADGRVAGLQTGSSTRKTKDTDTSSKTSAVEERDYSAEERRAYAKKGWALADGSYPIPDADALRSAAQLAASGHGDVKAARRLIKRRAKELGVKVSSLQGFGKKQARESQPLTLRERAMIGDLSLTEALDPDVREDPRTGLLERMSIDRDLV